MLFACCMNTAVIKHHLQLYTRYLYRDYPIVSFRSEAGARRSPSRQWMTTVQLYCSGVTLVDVPWLVPSSLTCQDELD